MTRRRTDDAPAPSSDNWLTLADAAREADQSPDRVRWLVLLTTLVLAAGALTGAWLLALSF